MKDTRYWLKGTLLALGLVTTLLVGGMLPAVRAANPRAPAACATPIKKQWLIKGNCGTNPNKHFVGTKDNQPLVFRTNKVERMRLDTNGNLGIGTTNPTHPLHVVRADAVLRLESTQSNGIAQTEYSTDARRYYTGVFGSSAGVLAGKYYIKDDTTGQSRLTIDTSGRVGIGTTSPGATLEVKGPDTSASTLAFAVNNSAGLPGLFVYDDRTVGIGAFAGSAMTHVCLNGNYFAGCNSAAEYVPTIDSGKGYPEAADLVSIVPDVANPFGDRHGPFTVQKTATACDSNLLGFIVRPESGADGVKLNEHYLPLAIYGYFPARVTMENGAIQRGDPITSSSKPGYGKKATGACKIIGYALEDANVEGTIQVFAHLSEHTLPLMDALVQENRALKQQLAAIEDRLAALEQGNPLTRSSTAHVSLPK